MASASILLHQMPDGSAHFDLLIEQQLSRARAAERPHDASAWSPPTLADIDNPDERRLLAFRLAERLDRARLGDALDAQRLPEHRARYLAHEGPIAGDRGCASRVAAGRVLELAAAAAQLECAVAWADRGVQRWTARRIAGQRWRIVVVA